MNSSIVINLIITAIFVLWGIEIHAQSSCDKLYSEGVSLQQTMTIPAQNKAISAFEKAKKCYDAKKNKDLCDKQIKVCRNTISLLRKSNNTEKRKDETNTQKEDSVAKSVETTKEQNKREITLSVTKVYVKFKGKGGEFQKVKVECNDDNWEISESPSWVHYSINSEKEIIIEVDKNPSNKEERSGTITVKCGDKTATVTIIQEKYKKFGII